MGTDLEKSFISSGLAKRLRFISTLIGLLLTGIIGILFWRKKRQPW